MGLRDSYGCSSVPLFHIISHTVMPSTVSFVLIIIVTHKDSVDVAANCSVSLLLKDAFCSYSGIIPDTLLLLTLVTLYHFSYSVPKIHGNFHISAVYFWVLSKEWPHVTHDHQIEGGDIASAPSNQDNEKIWYSRYLWRYNYRIMNWKMLSMLSVIWR